MRLTLLLPLALALSAALLHLPAAGQDAAAPIPSAADASERQAQEIAGAAAAEPHGDSTPPAAPAPPKTPPPRAPGMWDEPSEAELPPPQRRLRIGITMSIPAKPTSMYANGACGRFWGRRMRRGLCLT